MLFNSLTGFGMPPEYRRLLVAPEGLRSRLIAHIRTEAERGSEGRIIAKMNSLVDPDMVRELYKASQAGVNIDLIVRGMCTLVPGVPGFSENIRVRSILGRYLEHSRIYVFGDGDNAMHLLGSADLMTRNLDRRVEILVPIEDAALCAQIDQTLLICLNADRLTWTLDPEGNWNPVEDRGAVDPHRQLFVLAAGDDDRIDSDDLA